MAKILYVEDDPIMAVNVKEWLERDGHIIELADSGEDGLQLLRNFDFDIILLDWQLPGMSGLEVCKAYRDMDGCSWVIFITGLSDIGHKETGLDNGADDYICKPFDTRELSSRVKRALRRVDNKFQSELRIGDLLLDLSRREFRVKDKSVHLMPKEAALLEYLMRNPNKLAGTKKLLSAVWPSESEVSEGTVRTYMRTLRQKLALTGKEDLIKTVLGSGYIIETAAADS